MLQDKTIVVTGAARGIGKAVVSCCLREGANILAVDIDSTALDTLQKTDPSRIATTCLDVADRCAVEALFADSEAADGLVNNAGIYPARHILEYTDVELDRVIDVNLKGAFNFSRYYAQSVLRNRRQGAIVNMASLAGQEGSSDAAYGMSKAGLIGLTKSTAMNFAPDIRVNAVAPTVVETGMAAQIPAWRLEAYQQGALIKSPVQPLDVAETVVFLLSNRASHYTGTVLDINNGGYLR